METALYIHFPFCLKKCLYCDFNSVAGSRVAPEDYIAAVVREMELRAARLPSPVTASTLYFGGGTPSLLEPSLVAMVIEAAGRLYRLAATAEVTIEANPGTVTREKLSGYRQGGVNRLSLGVQSFQDRFLARLGRVHTAGEAVDAFAAARAEGFANIGVDLIHSLPGETTGLWEDDLHRAVLLGPEHISAYPLSVEAGTPFHRLSTEGKLPLPDEDEAVEMLEMTAAFLRDAGYDHYEIANFARPGRRSRHNQVYWRRGNYLGFGAGAHSFQARPGRGERWRNAAPVGSYMRAIRNDTIPVEETTLLTDREAMAEFLFLGLRLLEGVVEARFVEEFGLSVAAAFPGVVAKLCGQGLLEQEGGRIRLSARGMPLANQVFMCFL